MKGIVKHVHRAFKSVIQSAQWMDDSTKLKAVNKTNSMKLKISFSDKLKEKEEIDNYYSEVRYSKIMEQIYLR